VPQLEVEPCVRVADAIEQVARARADHRQLERRDVHLHPASAAGLAEVGVQRDEVVALGEVEVDGVARADLRGREVLEHRAIQLDERVDAAVVVD
jgi:hypothetical protein